MTPNQARVAAAILCEAAAQILFEAQIETDTANTLREFCATELSPGGPVDEIGICVEGVYNRLSEIVAEVTDGDQS